jgi:hypothetical protein
MIAHAISLSSTLALLMLAAAGRRVGAGRTAVQSRLRRSIRREAAAHEPAGRRHALHERAIVRRAGDPAGSGPSDRRQLDRARRVSGRLEPIVRPARGGNPRLRDRSPAGAGIVAAQVHAGAVERRPPHDSDRVA